MNYLFIFYYTDKKLFCGEVNTTEKNNVIMKKVSSGKN